MSPRYPLQKLQVWPKTNHQQLQRRMNVKIVSKGVNFRLETLEEHWLALTVFRCESISRSRGDNQWLLLKIKGKKHIRPHEDSNDLKVSNATKIFKVFLCFKVFYGLKVFNSLKVFNGIKIYKCLKVSRFSKLSRSAIVSNSTRFQGL